MALAGEVKYMSLSDLFIKAIGVVLALAGLALCLAAVGIKIFPVAITGFGIIAAIVVGLLFIGIGIYIIKGGNITA